MTFKEESVLDDKNSYTRPTSTSIVGDLLDDNGRQQHIQNTNNTEKAAVIDITKSVSAEEKHLVKEAGHGGAVLGFLVGGPIGSALLGFGSAYGTYYCTYILLSGREGGGDYIIAMVSNSNSNSSSHFSLSLSLSSFLPFSLFFFDATTAIRKPKDSTLGKSSRSLAEFTMSLKEKAKGVEAQHHFVQRSKTSLDHFCGDTTHDDDDNNDNDHANDHNDTATKNLKQKQRRHSKNIAFQTRSFIVSSWDAASQYTKKNQLVGRGVEGTGKGIEYLDGVISNVRSGANKKSE